MRDESQQTSKPETILAALLYLMTHYQRTGCPRLADCVSRHMACLAVHPEAPSILRDMCAGLRLAWEEVARLPHPAGQVLQ